VLIMLDSGDPNQVAKQSDEHGGAVRPCLRVACPGCLAGSAPDAHARCGLQHEFYGAYDMVGRLDDIPVGSSQAEHEVMSDPSYDYLLKTLGRNQQSATSIPTPRSMVAFPSPLQQPNGPSGRSRVARRSKRVWPVSKWTAHYALCVHRTSSPES